MIGQVYIYPDYAPFPVPVPILRPASLILFFTATSISCIPEKHTMRPAVVANFNSIVPGHLYKQSNVNKTYRNLSELGPIRYTNIVFTDDSVTLRDRNRLLDCRIELTRKKVQSYQAEVAGTNSSGDLGIRGNISTRT